MIVLLFTVMKYSPMLILAFFIREYAKVLSVIMVIYGQCVITGYWYCSPNLVLVREKDYVLNIFQKVSSLQYLIYFGSCLLSFAL